MDGKASVNRVTTCESIYPTIQPPPLYPSLNIQYSIRSCLHTRQTTKSIHLLKSEMHPLPLNTLCRLIHFKTYDCLTSIQLSVNPSFHPSNPLWRISSSDAVISLHIFDETKLALGDRYRKFYRTLNNAKKPFNSIFNSKNFQPYSFKILFI